jgi:hypothetical protein
MAHHLVDRLQDLAGEDLRNFNPITGFLDAPLLPLEDAIGMAFAASEDLDPQMGTRVECACDFADGLIADTEDAGETELLSRDEIAAIHLYTQNSNFYRDLNKLLRSRARELLRPYAPYLRLLLGALHKLPRVKGVVYRGVKGNMSAKYKTGSKFVWWAVSSTTSTIDCLSNDDFFGTSGERTFFAISAHHAVNIARYSSVPSENELVLVPGARLRVVGAAAGDADLCFIQCEETAAPLGFFEFEEQSSANHSASSASVAESHGGATVDSVVKPVSMPISHATSAPMMSSSVAPSAILSHGVSSSASSSVAMTFTASLAPVPDLSAPAPVPVVQESGVVPPSAATSIDIRRTLVEGRLMTDKHARPGDRVNLRLQLCDAAGLFVLHTGYRWRIIIQSRDLDSDEKPDTLDAQQNVQVQDTGMGTYKVSFNAVAGPRRLLIVSETTGQCVPHLDFDVGDASLQAASASAAVASAPAPVPAPVIVARYCDGACTRKHDPHTSICGRCSQPWGRHSGHDCPNGGGARGTFLLPPSAVVDVPPVAAPIAPVVASSAAYMPAAASVVARLPTKAYHSGEWRSQAVRTRSSKNCSREPKDGQVCKHGSVVITREHWYALRVRITNLYYDSYRREKYFNQDMTRENPIYMVLVTSRQELLRLGRGQVARLPAARRHSALARGRVARPGCNGCVLLGRIRAGRAAVCARRPRARRRSLVRITREHTTHLPRIRTFSPTRHIVDLVFVP